MIILTAAALAVAQPAVVQTAPMPAPHSGMGQAGPKKEECCCCKDKMGKDHASHEMDRMPDHPGHSSH
jgi:hypothetical protein